MNSDIEKSLNKELPIRDSANIVWLSVSFAFLFFGLF